MSIVKTLDVFCDGPDCVRWVSGVTGNRARTADALDRAAERGWTRRRVTTKTGTVATYDLCPQCSRLPDEVMP